MRAVCGREYCIGLGNWWLEDRYPREPCNYIWWTNPLSDLYIIISMYIYILHTYIHNVIIFIPCKLECQPPLMCAVRKPRRVRVSCNNNIIIIIIVCTNHICLSTHNQLCVPPPQLPPPLLLSFWVFFRVL